jgi:hypothetical protein
MIASQPGFQHINILQKSNLQYVGRLSGSEPSGGARASQSWLPITSLIIRHHDVEGDTTTSSQIAPEDKTLCRILVGSSRAILVSQVLSESFPLFVLKRADFFVPCDMITRACR